MINIHFNTDNITVGERDGLVSLLRALRFDAPGAEVPPVTLTVPLAEAPIAKAPTPEPEAVAPDPEPEPAPEAKPRRGRPRKEAAEAPVAPAAEAPADTTAKPPTADDLRAALMAYTKAHDVNAGLELLKDFGCQRISEMVDKPQADQLEFIRLATKA